MPALPDGGRTADKRAAVRRTAESLPQVRVREYAGGDHDLHAQQPEAVAADLLALAAEVARP
jgi:pimeloyl-ACP methyl ester carboxylesterase